MCQLKRSRIVEGIAAVVEFRSMRSQAQRFLCKEEERDWTGRWRVY